MFYFFGLCVAFLSIVLNWQSYKFVSVLISVANSCNVCVLLAVESGGEHVVVVVLRRPVVVLGSVSATVHLLRLVVMTFMVRLLSFRCNIAQSLPSVQFNPRYEQIDTDRPVVK